MRIFQSAKSKKKATGADFKKIWADWQKNLLDFAVDFVIVLLIVFGLIRPFVIAPFKIQQSSMEPNAHHNEYVIVSKLPYNSLIGWSEYRRGDIVVFRPAANPANFLIKRVIATPGETVRITGGAVFIRPLSGGDFSQLPDDFLAQENQGNTCPTTNGHICSPAEKSKVFELTVPPRSYFVLGDNRLASRDSRSCFTGYCASEQDYFLTEDEIEGRAFLVLAQKYGEQFWQISFRSARFFENQFENLK